MKRKLTPLLLLLALGANKSHALFDKQMYSINTANKLKGPVVNTTSTKNYNSKVFRLIVEEAHNLAKEYYEYGDYTGYWTFMVAALTVPKHEGANIHIRKVTSPDKCRTKSNSGSIISHSSSTTKVFKRIFKEGNSNEMAFPECSFFDNKSFFYQLLHGADGTDISIMQINMRWHEDKYLATGDWQSVRKSIRYGLGLLKKGFKTVYGNTSKYPCVLKYNKVYPYDLIRASWAGVYNSGNAKNSCRFTDPNNDWKKNDAKFKETLDRILSLTEKANRDKHYSVNNTEDIVLSNIVKALGSRQNNKFVQDFIANRSIDLDAINEEASEVEQEIIKEEAVMSITATNLSIRTDAGTHGTYCGALPQGTIITTTGKTHHNWRQLEVDSHLKSFITENKEICLNDKTLFSHGGYMAKSVVAVVTPQTNVNQDDELEVETKPVETATLKKGIVLGSGATLRQGPSKGNTMAPKTGEVLRGNETVEIIDTVYASQYSKYPWYKVSSPKKGWVYGKLIKITNE